jgi:hypothetical protein
MMGLSEIRHLSREAAREASKVKKTPYVPFDEEEIKNRKFWIPNLGDYVPKGWKEVERLFCDKSGWGSPGELALTIDQLQDKMLKYYKEGKTYGYGMVEEGQFQCYVGVFEKGKKRTRTCLWCDRRVEIKRGANAEHQKNGTRCQGSGMTPVPRGRE